MKSWQLKNVSQNKGYLRNVGFKHAIATIEIVDEPKGYRADS